jgi:hypothetical protein
MKKWMALILIVLSLPFLTVEATPPIEIGVKLKIDSKDCNNGFFNNGHFDLLVLREEIGDRLLATISDQYTYHYGDIDNIDYLTVYSTTWISYQAYVSDAYTDFIGSCNVTLMGLSDIIKFSAVKLVYFDNDGTTLYISSEIPTQDADERGDYVDINLDFDADEPYHLDISYKNEQHSYAIIVLLILAAYLFKYGGMLVLSIAGILIIYAVIRVIIVQLRRRNHP